MAGPAFVAPVVSQEQDWAHCLAERRHHRIPSAALCFATHPLDVAALHFCLRSVGARPINCQRHVRDTFQFVAVDWSQIVNNATKQRSEAPLANK